MLKKLVKHTPEPPYNESPGSNSVSAISSIEKRRVLRGMGGDWCLDSCIQCPSHGMTEGGRRTGQLIQRWVIEVNTQLLGRDPLQWEPVNLHLWGKRYTNECDVALGSTTYGIAVIYIEFSKQNWIHTKQAIPRHLLLFAKCTSFP